MPSNVVVDIRIWTFWFILMCRMIHNMQSSALAHLNLETQVLQVLLSLHKSLWKKEILKLSNQAITYHNYKSQHLTYTYTIEYFCYFVLSSKKSVKNVVV